MNSAVYRNPFLTIIIHESREVTVRATKKTGEEDNSIEIKVLKKRVDEFGEAGGVIGTEASFPEKAFTRLMNINWTLIFFGMLGSGELPAEMLVPTSAEDDAGLRMESRFTDLIFSEIGKHELVTIDLLLLEKVQARRFKFEHSLRHSIQ